MSELDDILTFVRVAELGGLSRTARALGVSKSIVSRRLDRLEGQLATKLLQRTTRGAVPTEAGRLFEARCARILADLDEAKAEVARRDSQLAGRLRLAAPLSFGWRHLAPALAAFAVAHPYVALDVSYADRSVDLLNEGFDAAVRLGVPQSSQLVARRIAPVRVAVVASPAYVVEHGKPGTPLALAQHACLQTTADPAGQAWRFRVGRRWISVPLGRARYRADSGEALLEAALAGLGVALLPTFIAGEAMRHGRVVQLLQAYPTPERTLSVLRPPGPPSAIVRALTDFLVERFGPEPYWDPCWDVKAAGSG